MFCLEISPGLSLTGGTNRHNTGHGFLSAKGKLGTWVTSVGMGLRAGGRDKVEIFDPGLIFRNQNKPSSMLLQTS